MKIYWLTKGTIYIFLITCNATFIQVGNYVSPRKKSVSKSYEYKLKPTVKKKISNLMSKEIPLLKPLFPSTYTSDLTEFSKVDRKDCMVPVKDFALSRRRSRVQIPAGALALDSIGKKNLTKYKKNN